MKKSKKLFGILLFLLHFTNFFYGEDRDYHCSICDSYSQTGTHYCTHQNSGTNKEEDKNPSSPKTYSCIHCGAEVSNYGSSCSSCAYQILYDMDYEDLVNQESVVLSYLADYTSDIEEQKKIINMYIDDYLNSIKETENQLNTQDELENEKRYIREKKAAETKRKELEAKVAAIGDPVRITNGEFVQTETDFYTKTFEINRIYTSFNKTIGSFGEGFTSILDEGLIFGFNENTENEIELLNQTLEVLSLSEEKLKNILFSNFDITNYTEVNEIIKNQEGKIKKLYEKAYSLYLEAKSFRDEHKNKSKSLEANAKYQEIKELYENVLAEKSKFEEKKTFVLDIVKEIEKIQVEKAINLEKIVELQLIKEKSEKIQQENTRRNFQNLPESYYQVGYGFVTLIEGDSGIKRFKILDDETKYFLLNQDNTLNYKEKILKTEDGYLYQQKNGTEKLYNKEGFLVCVKDVNKNETVFYRNEENQVTKIKTQENTEYEVFYEMGKITKIKNLNTCKEYNYQYEKGKLVTVISPENLVYKYFYNAESGMLAKYVKPDGSFTAYYQEEKSEKAEFLTTSTQNEEGFRENFDFYPNEKITIYTNHDGEQEIYYFDENGKTTKITDSRGNLEENTYDTNGNLVLQIKNGKQTKFYYDENQNITKIESFERNVKGNTFLITEHFSYDEFGNITNYIDGENNYYKFLRDERGNLLGFSKNGTQIIEYELNSLGLVTKQKELIDETTNLYNTTEYQYDANQNLITKKINNTIYTYEYDADNQVVKSFCNNSEEFEVFYEDFSTKVKEKNGLETVYKYNNRFDIVEKKEIDTVLNQCHTTKYKYDGRHLLVEETVFLDNENTEKTEYKYSAFGNLESTLKTKTDSNYGFFTISKQKGNLQTVREGVFLVEKAKNLLEKPFYQWKDEDIEELIRISERKNIKEQKYMANENGVLIKDSIGREIFYKYNGKNQIEQIKNLGKVGGNENPEEVLYTYKKDGNLESIENQFGGKSFYEYSNVNNLVEVKNQYGGQKIYYTNSGLPKKVIDAEGFETVYTYNENGLLESEKSYKRSVYYFYDEKNRLIKEIWGETPNENTARFFTKYEYDDENRKTLINQGNKVFTELYFDAFGNVVKEVNGEGNEKKYEYNGKNQQVCFYDGYGNKTEYKYNALGLLEKVIFPDESFEKYTYNERGSLTKIENTLGIYSCYEYDGENRLIKEKTSARPEITYEYDSFDRLILVKTGGNITERYEYFDNGQTVFFYQGNLPEEKLTQNLDDFGQLSLEADSLGVEQSYYYDKNGNLEKKIDKNHIEKIITKKGNSQGYEEIIEYSDGTKKILTYDKCGVILKEVSLHSSTSYTYDSANLLILQTDLQTGFSTQFSYDKAGRKIKTSNSSQKVLYNYGNNSELLSVTDSQNGIKIDFKYDSLGREIEKRYENGNRESTVYDKTGRLYYRYLEDSQKNVLNGEGYYYDKNGFVRGKVNHKGEITLYDYDNLGQLRATYSSISEDLENAQKTEIKENGGKLIERQELKTARYFFDYEESFELQELINKINRNSVKTLGNIFYCNIELYEYDNCGNRITKETPFGRIIYKYDSENRLIGSTSFGTENQKNLYIKNEYDKNGNLLKSISPQKEIYYSYNAENRIETVLIIDHVHKTKTEESYFYDSFGRRVKEIKNGIEVYYQYEGLSFNLLTETMYKVDFELDSELNLSFNSNYKNSYDFSSENLAYRYRYITDEVKPVSTKSYYYKDGNLVANADTRSSAYFFSDYQGSTRYVTDTEGFSESYNYDSFGKPIYNGDYVEYEDGYFVEGLSKSDLETSGYETYKTTNWLTKREENPQSSLYQEYLSVAGYSGKSYNQDTGLNNYGFRDYSPTQARFITVDPIRDGTNWYTFAVNNPVCFVDLWGLCTGDKKASVWDNYTGSGNPYKDSEKYTVFIQTLFTKEKQFSEKYSETACNATAILNIFSEQYTKETGNVLSIEEGIEILRNVPNNIIDKDDAYVYDLAPALNAMIDYVEEKYEEDIFLGKFGYSPSWLGYKKTALVGARYSILVVTSNSFPEHYVNILLEIDEKVIVYDTYDGNIKNKTSSEIIKQNDITYYIPN